MSMVYQKDKRSGITYAYENRRIWSEERQKYVNQRKLIGRVINEQTKEIAPTDGRCRKRSPYLTEEEKARISNEKPLEFSSALFNPTATHKEDANDSKGDTSVISEIKAIQETLLRLETGVEEIRKALACLVHEKAEK